MPLRIHEVAMDIVLGEDLDATTMRIVRNHVAQQYGHKYRNCIRQYEEIIWLVSLRDDCDDLLEVIKTIYREGEADSLKPYVLWLDLISAAVDIGDDMPGYLRRRAKALRKGRVVLCISWCSEGRYP